MTDTNRVRLTWARKAEFGVANVSPRMRKVRFTGESLKYAPKFEDSAEIRDDRMTTEPAATIYENQGGYNFELTYPDQDSPLADQLASLMFRDWINTPRRFNDGTAASAITSVTADTGFVVAASAGTSVDSGAFQPGHLVLASGFVTPSNNGVFAAGAGSNGTLVGVAGLTADASPAGTAQLKVVGFVGAAGDVTATTSGLGSTTRDFTTLGLAAGQWVKIGGTGSGSRFATAANNTFARVAAISAHALSLDHLPPNWGVDSGAGVALKVWFGDRTWNGVDMIAGMFEKGFMQQNPVTYMVHDDMVVDKAKIQIESGKKIDCSFDFVGLGADVSAGTSVDDAPDAATVGRFMSANANVGRITEGGNTLLAPNWIKTIGLDLANNLRMKDAADEQSAVDIGVGEFTCEGSLQAHFGTDALLNKFLAGTPTSLSFRVQKDSQAIVCGLPRVTYNGEGTPNAAAKNQDVMLTLKFKASADTLTNAHMTLDRIPYYEV